MQPEDGFQETGDKGTKEIVIPETVSRAEVQPLSTDKGEEVKSVEGKCFSSGHEKDVIAEKVLFH